MKRSARCWQASALDVMGNFAALLDPGIAVAEAPLSGEPPDLPADEAVSIAHAVNIGFVEGSLSSRGVSQAQSF